jgi:hypothetical protein
MRCAAMRQVSISNAITIKFAHDDRQHTEIDLVPLKPDAT